MSLNAMMHPRNPFKDRKPNFKQLADKYEPFRQNVTFDAKGKVILDFKNPSCLRALTWALLKDGFEIEVDMPLDRLIPTIPLRLNYLLWLEDIFPNQTSLHGIDIGCGAACVYPLLGAKKNGWNFVATEADATNAEYATKNVQQNKLLEKVTVEKVTEDSTLLDIMEKRPSETFDFCMCNPPFFGSNLEAWGMLTSRKDSRPEPNSVNTASSVESIVPGGEVEFVRRMIESSLQLKNRVRVYTSMLGKKTSLSSVKELLRINGINNIGSTEFCQGNTMRWGIGWSFESSVVFPKAMVKKCEKARPPLSHEFQPGVVSTLAELATEMESIFKELKIGCSCTLEEENKRAWTLSCKENTWAHQRRKRRLESRAPCGSDTNDVKELKDDEDPDHKIKRRKVDESPEMNEPSGAPKNDANENDLCVKLDDSGDFGSTVTVSTTESMTSVDDDDPDQRRPELLMTCKATLSRSASKLLFELDWIGGQNRELMHQLFQFFKNKLK